MSMKQVAWLQIALRARQLHKEFGLTFEGAKLQARDEFMQNAKCVSGQLCSTRQGCSCDNCRQYQKLKN